MTKRLWNLPAATAALALATALVLSGCPTSADDGNGKKDIPSGTIGAKLEISNVQVFTEIDDDENFTVTYKPFNGDVAAFDYVSPANGSAAIAKGRLTFSFGVPDENDNNFATVEDFLSSYTYSYDDVAATTADAKIIYMRLDRLSHSATTYNGKTENYRYVDYCYVDRDVTITGKGRLNHNESDWDGQHSEYNTTTASFSLALKEGWNALYTETITSHEVKDGNKIDTGTETLIVGNPEVRWVYWDNNQSSGRLPADRAAAGANR